VSDTAAVQRHGARSAWRVATSRNFGPYFVGNAVSASGTWFQNLAASVLVFQLTHSPLLLGVLNVCQFLPVLVLSPWAGRVADLYDRKRVLLVTQPAAAVASGALALIALTGRATVAIVFVFSICLGSLTAFSNASQMALIGSLVHRDDLPQAVALNSITFNAARAIGPVCAAAVIAVFGTATAFAVNSLSYVVLAVGVLLVHPAPTARSGRASLRESFAVLRATPRLLGYLAVVLTVSFATDPVNTEGPALADAFGLSPVWAGAIVGVFGAGAVSAGVLVGGRTASSRRMAGTLVVMGCGLVGLGVMPWFALALVFAGAAGVGYLTSNVAATSQLQLGVDEALRGRIMAIWSIAFLGIRPVASVIDGSLAGVIGVRAATVVMATPAFVLAAALLARARRDSGVTGVGVRERT
jgi:predicted MFS family arabinose efflux permease